MTDDTKREVDEYMAALLQRPWSFGLNVMWERMSEEARAEVKRRLDGAENEDEEPK